MIVAGSRRGALVRQLEVLGLRSVHDPDTLELRPLTLGVRRRGRRYQNCGRGAHGDEC